MILIDNAIVEEVKSFLYQWKTVHGLGNKQYPLQLHNAGISSQHLL